MTRRFTPGFRPDFPLDNSGGIREQYWNMRRLSLPRFVWPLALAAAVLIPLAWAPVGGQEQHPGEYSPLDVENGSRLYTAQCITCHGPMGNGVVGVDLRRGSFKRVTTDDELRKVIVGGVPGTAMQKFDLSAPEQNQLVAYIRSGLEVGGRAAKVGDPTRGKQVFDTKGGCATCHRTGGSGARKGPDLSDIGSLRSASMLQQALVEPTGSMLPINRPIRAVTKAGKTITGRRLNEDTYTVQLVDENGRLQSLTKADLKEYQVLTASPMPSFRDKLTVEEISDVVAYLLTLKG
ncbi:MAG: c-type cytochrome [Acidimicrobiia bacterium]|nr:c-type cytochrome [Acidimicrobiia bacterium]